MTSLVFPDQAAGSLVERNGKVVGSTLIGQSFSDPGHFWSRPSATSPMPYNAAASSGSNLGPLNPALAQAIKDRVEIQRATNPGGGQTVPADLVYSSASGLDPHISVAAALYQADRIAQARNVPVARVEQLVREHAEGALLGLLGEPRVNVLALNLALDALR